MRKFMETAAILVCLLMLFGAFPHTVHADDRYLEINETNFPDEAFRSWIIGHCPVSQDENGTYYMTENQVNSVTYINCEYSSIQSLSGIEHFKKLTTLYCNNNMLSELNVSGNTLLKKLICQNNRLTALDLSKNTKLEELYCDNNPLDTLDLTHNTALKELTCSGVQLETLDLSHNTKLQSLVCNDCSLTVLDVSRNTALNRLVCRNNQLTALNLSKNTNLSELSCQGNRLTQLDVSGLNKLYYLGCAKNSLTSLTIGSNAELHRIECYENQLTELALDGCSGLETLVCDSNHLAELDLSANKQLFTLSCNDNALTSLDLSANTLLWEVQCSNNALRELRLLESDRIVVIECKNNRLAWMDLRNMPEVHCFLASGQTIPNQKGEITDSAYIYDMTQIVPKEQLSNVTLSDPANRLDPDTGIVTFPHEVEEFSYIFSTGYALAEEYPLAVTVQLCFGEQPAFDGTIEWNEEDVQFKGTTPYVIANGSAQTPRFTVKDADGKIIDAGNYTYEYRENTNAGTGYVIVTFTAQYSGTARAWFKIYLPPTTMTTVENVGKGIQITWDPVPGAAGYVIYRRAWSSTTNGWTAFARWNNTTETEWIDSQVYAGSRYQYGIKAYFAQRVDPVSGATIGGNVGDNYNLGIVGPLKTAVRITTLTLNSITAGTKRLTAKWTAKPEFTGYEVQIATDTAFTKNVQTVKITDSTASQATIKSLKSGKTYYVRIRAYHLFEGMTYYGKWTDAKSCKIK